jgi:ribonuclease D
MDTRWLLVDMLPKMQCAIQALKSASVISIDTEYDSFRYFREKLCLIQIYIHDTVYIFDPLGHLNLSFLGEYFNNDQILKIFHAAENDIRLLKRDYGFHFRNIFDTHRAAMILGFQELSLEKMIKEFVGVELQKNKKIQRSRWDHRPLTEDQLRYAAQDVIYLPVLYEKESMELRSKGLQEETTKAFAKIAEADWREKTFDRQGYKKIKGCDDLNQKQKNLLKTLYCWRFQRAKDENKAIFMFLPDNNLLGLAQDATHPEKYLSKRKMKVYGEEIERLISDA